MQIQVVQKNQKIKANPNQRKEKSKNLDLAAPKEEKSQRKEEVLPLRRNEADDQRRNHRRR